MFSRMDRHEMERLLFQTYTRTTSGQNNEAAQYVELVVLGCIGLFYFFMATDLDEGICKLKIHVIQAVTGPEVLFRWVPAHAHVENNERAHKLARSATAKGIAALLRLSHLCLWLHMLY